MKERIMKKATEIFNWKWFSPLLVGICAIVIGIKLWNGG
jgi:hypothetical protein